VGALRTLIGPSKIWTHRKSEGTERQVDGQLLLQLITRRFSIKSLLFCSRRTWLLRVGWNIFKLDTVDKGSCSHEEVFPLVQRELQMKVANWNFIIIAETPVFPWETEFSN